MTQQQNDELTRVGPGTPAGALLRNYWMPAALSEELDAGRSVIPVSLAGECLALYRAGNGTLSLIQRACAHRGVDLSKGRVEHDGIRCPFHGWHYAVDGQCTEQPAEPAGSTLHQSVRLKNYPVIEKNGIIWAYLGTGDAPAFPMFDCFVAPESHVFAFKGLWRCNWLQALEVGIDPAHASFLHRFEEDEDTADSYGKQFRDAVDNSNTPLTRLLRDNDQPEIKIEETDFGMRLIALRRLANGKTHVRVTNQLFPCAIHIPISREMTITQWHVPVDDHNCYWYAMFTSFTDPVDKATMRTQRLEAHTLPEYAPVRNRDNDYLFDPEEQRTKTYTGMGMDINVHDQWACESMGTIQDRTTEFLATTDIGIATHRRKLRRAMRQLRTAKGADGLPLRITKAQAPSLTGPAAVDAVTADGNWQQAWHEQDAVRRAASSWASDSNATGAANT